MTVTRRLILAGLFTAPIAAHAGERRVGSNGTLLHYEAEGAPSDPGKWRVNPATGAYESLWRMGGWTPYHIVIVGDNYFWVDSRDRRYPFRILPD